jgi:hypothetical protein
MEMTIVCDPKAMRKVAVAQPSVLSFRQAVSDFGFVELLGPLNTYLGSDVHRLVLKNRLYPALRGDDGLAAMAGWMKRAFAAHVAPTASAVFDVLPTFRKILLHATVGQLVGSAVGGLAFRQTTNQKWPAVAAQMSVQWLSTLRLCVSFATLQPIQPAIQAPALTSGPMNQPTTPTHQSTTFTTQSTVPTEQHVAWACCLLELQVLERLPRFVDQFMAFQDALEHATASATVLPRFIAKPFILQPAAAMRAPLVTDLTGVIQAMWDGEAGQSGVWIAAMKGLRPVDRLPGFADFVGFTRGGKSESTRNSANTTTSGRAGAGTLTAVEAAEFVCGLLFAAHKNPAIGSSQALLFLLTPGNEAHLAAAVAECRSNHPKIAKYSADEYSHAAAHVGRCVAEAVRLSAHSIGAVRKVVHPNGFKLELSDGTWYTLPRGAYVGISHILPHMDESNFDDAASFNPDRFDQSLVEAGNDAGNDPYKSVAGNHLFLAVATSSYKPITSPFCCAIIRCTCTIANSRRVPVTQQSEFEMPPSSFRYVIPTCNFCKATILLVWTPYGSKMCPTCYGEVPVSSCQSTPCVQTYRLQCLKCGLVFLVAIWSDVLTCQLSMYYAYIRIFLVASWLDVLTCQLRMYSAYIRIFASPQYRRATARVQVHRVLARHPSLSGQAARWPADESVAKHAIPPVQRRD